MHKANQIINAITALLDPIVGLTVVVNRVALDEGDLPAVRVLFGSNSPQSVKGQFTDWQLTVHADIALTGYNDDINGETTKWLLAVHQKLMADPTLGLSFVIDTEPLGNSETQFNHESAIVVAEVPNTWRITYRANTQDPSL